MKDFKYINFIIFFFCLISLFCSSNKETQTISNISSSHLSIKNVQVLSSTYVSNSPIIGLTEGKWIKQNNFTQNINYKGKNIKTSGKFDIYFPKGYSEKAYFPLIIALHGWGGNKEEWTKNSSIDNYADEHSTVIVCPDMGKTVYETDYYPETSSKWNNIPSTIWIAEALLPYIRENYSIGKDKSFIGTIGFSTGGKGAIIVAEKYPNLFSACAGMSGTYNFKILPKDIGEYRIHVPIYGSYDDFPERYDLDDCCRDELLDNLKDVAVYISHGKKDKIVPYTQSKALIDLISEKGFTLTHLLSDNDGHDWKFWNKSLPQAMSFICGHLSKPKKK